MNKVTKEIVAQLPRPLSAKYESDFAYPTVKDRLPVILTRVVDTVYRMKSEILKTHGEAGVKDLKTIVGHLSRLKNELQTNKPLSLLDDACEDVQIWNAYLEKDKAVQLQDGECTASWFQSPWLYIECYFYRRIMSAVALSAQLKSLDPFCGQKQSALLESLPAISTLASYLNGLPSTTGSSGRNGNDELFLRLLQVALWGNKCDLSISAGAENSQTINPLAQLESLHHHILCDNSKDIWSHLSGLRNSGAPSKVQLAIILDNAGFELFTDLCLADFLVERKLVDVVHFHAKTIPWFVSDVTPSDWDWTLEMLSTSEDAAVMEMGKRSKARIQEGSWILHAHPFWTFPHDFQSMESVAPDLYHDLTQSGMIIFKGDLNYRKLASDLKWTATTEFPLMLRNFRPAPLCVLRTLKCDLVVGLAPGQAEKAEAQSSDWMLTGSYAVIQFVPRS